MKAMITFPMLSEKQDCIALFYTTLCSDCTPQGCRMIHGTIFHPLEMWKETVRKHKGSFFFLFDRLFWNDFRALPSQTLLYTYMENWNKMKTL